MTILLFDLDGTLVDSSPGILAAFRHSFEQMNWPCPDLAELMTFIGPPLEVTFAHYSSDEQAVETAITHFRDYYDQTGLYQAEVYSGVKECLTALKAASHQLFVATSKNEPVAQVMLAELGLAHFFTGIYGSVKKRHHKADVIQACLDDHKPTLNQVAMIGDTKFDMIGAKSVGVQAIGLTWGFGRREELLEHGANLIIDQPTDLLSHFP